MSSFLIQSTADSLVFYLETTAGVAATGLVHTDVTAALKKSDESAFVSKALTALNFAELGDGYYSISLLAADTDTLGSLYMRVTGATIKSALVSAYVAVSAPDAPVSGPSLTTVDLFGYVYKPSGEARAGVSVQVRVISQPALLHAGTEGLVLSDELVTARTDAEGYFIISLVAGSYIDFMIPAANYRRVLTVPSSNSNVFDID